MLRISVLIFKSKLNQTQLMCLYKVWQMVESLCLVWKSLFRDLSSVSQTCCAAGGKLRKTAESRVCDISVWPSDVVLWFRGLMWFNTVSSQNLVLDSEFRFRHIHIHRDKTEWMSGVSLERHDYTISFYLQTHDVPNDQKNNPQKISTISPFTWVNQCTVHVSVHLFLDISFRL